MYSSLAGGLIGSTAATTAAAAGSEWWAVLLSAVLPTLVGFMLELVVGILNKKGVIDTKTKNTLEEKIDEIEDNLKGDSDEQ